MFKWEQLSGGTTMGAKLVLCKQFLVKGAERETYSTISDWLYIAG